MCVDVYFRSQDHCRKDILRTTCTTVFCLFGFFLASRNSFMTENVHIIMLNFFLLTFSQLKSTHSFQLTTGDKMLTIFLWEKPIN